MQNRETVKPTLVVQKLRHRNADWWALKCEEREPFNSIVKKMEGRQWSATWSAWLIPLNVKQKPELKADLANRFSVNVVSGQDEVITQSSKQGHPIAGKGSICAKNRTQNGPWISDENRKAMQLYHKELILKGYSPSTLKTYESEFGSFLVTIKGVPAKDFTTERIKDYLCYCHTKLNLTEATLHSKMNALKFYYEQVLHRERFFWEIPRPKKRMQLPKVISEEKIVAGIERLENLKHKALIMLAYSAGLRVSEAVNLKIADIQSDRMQILIRQSKGKKDRMVPLSKVLLGTLRAYYLLYKPKEWLFEGQKEGTPVTARTAQVVFNRVYNRLGLPKGISFHALRHSYATHLVENGIDVTFVQELLGHNDVRTTLRYMHVSQRKINQIESPLDRAMRKNQEPKNEEKKSQ